MAVLAGAACCLARSSLHSGQVRTGVSCWPLACCSCRLLLLLTALGRHSVSQVPHGRVSTESHVCTWRRALDREDNAAWGADMSNRCRCTPPALTGRWFWDGPDSSLNYREGVASPVFTQPPSTNVSPRKGLSFELLTAKAPRCCSMSTWCYRWACLTHRGTVRFHSSEPGHLSHVCLTTR